MGPIVPPGPSGERAGADWRANQVETALSSAIDQLPLGLAGACRRVIQAGGKRLRPELVIRCADVGPDGSSGAVAAAAAVELLHSASLVHDDLLDDADTRRGVAAIHRREGPSSAVIAGDALIAVSWRMIAGCGPENAAELGGALLAMCDGQTREDALRFHLDADSADVVRVAELKTGALLESACRIGARLGNCTEQQVQALGDFGRELGTQLQILDDVLDVVADEATLGKPTGGDFRSGLLTLPTVFGLAAGQPRAGRLRNLFVAGMSTAAAREARSIVLESGAVARAVATAHWHADRAARAAAAANAQELVSLPDTFLRHQLRKVPSDSRLRVVSPHLLGSSHQQHSSDSGDGWGAERAG